jgi:threonine/homoserine/homoserine lactone efflux protein
LFLTTEQFFLYITSVLILNITPGNDVLFIGGQTMKGGLRYGLLAVLGITSGLACYIIATTFGLAKIFSSSTYIFHAFRIAGAFYLIYLAYQSFSNHEVSQSDQQDHDASVKFSKVYRQGMITTLLNPKVGVFLITFLPQFINDQQSVQSQLLTLGAIFIGCGTIVNVMYAFIFSKIGKRFLQNSQRQAIFRKMTGCIFLVLAARLLWS